MKLIKDVQIIKKPRHYDERGWLQEVRRVSDIDINDGVIGYSPSVKQVYITNAEKHVTKAFHYHLFQIDFFTCIKGKIKLVLIDTRIDSPTFGEINTFILENMNQSVLIPNKVMHGFQGLREGENLVLNCPSEEYNHSNPDEYRYDYLSDFYILQNGTITQDDIYNDLSYEKTIKIPKDLWTIKNG
jgi:dTDP-4-dehydrorhamnose 3,5-epimerase